MANNIYDEFVSKLNDDKAHNIKLIDDNADLQIENNTKQISDLTDAFQTNYEKYYKLNAVQKLINEKVISEQNSILGLRNSGINNIQKINANHMYDNTKSMLDTDRKATLKKLDNALALSIGAINEGRKWQTNSIEDVHNRLLLQLKSENQAVYNKDDITKNDTFNNGINPLTETRNIDVENGVLENGYQPDNINGVKLTKLVGGENGDNTAQNVWVSDNGYYYVWRDEKNRYEPLALSDILQILGVSS